jgi:ribosomal protein S18 acetylase RimI-like enzyme
VLVVEEVGEVIGFATCQACADALHLWELAVHRDHQGRGAGRTLMAAIIALARERGLTAVTLTTFGDVPWNGPFYRRLGFRTLAAGELNERLRAVSAQEAALGLDVAARCAMRLVL